MSRGNLKQVGNTYKCWLIGTAHCWIFTAKRMWYLSITGCHVDIFNMEIERINNKLLKRFSLTFLKISRTGNSCRSSYKLGNIKVMEYLGVWICLNRTLFWERHQIVPSYNSTDELLIFEAYIIYYAYVYPSVDSLLVTSWMGYPVSI